MTKKATINIKERLKLAKQWDKLEAMKSNLTNRAIFTNITTEKVNNLKMK